MTRPAVVRLVGNSSRFDRSARSLLRAVRTYRKRRWPNFIVSTEVGRNERSGALRGLLGFGLVHFEDARRGEDEAAIQFRRYGWRKISARADSLSSTGIARRGGQRCYSVDALFESRRTKQRVMICAFHLPNTEDGQYGIWIDCVARLTEKFDQWTRDPSIGTVILVGDWNANWRSAAMRRQLRTAFPGADFTWSGGRAPTTSGTHGFNLIDYACVHGGTITRAELLADDASSDHRPWFMRVQLGAVS